MSKKPAPKLTDRDGKPIVFPPTWGQVKPVKPTRVDKPRDTFSCQLKMWGGELWIDTPNMRLTPEEARIHSKRLLHAAAYLEQEARRGK